MEENTIFVHAGIDEEAGDMWEWETSEDVFTSKYPAETGKIEGLDIKVVAGHVGTAEISGDKFFHDIYFDGESHYYIDGTVLDSGVIPVLMVDTENDKYYQVTDSGKRLIEPYEDSGLRNGRLKGQGADVRTWCDCGREIYIQNAILQMKRE